jgi:hypothetical protein
MIALLWFLAFLAIAALAVAVIAEGGGQVDALLAEPTDDHMRVALENTSATPIYDALAVEVFRRELDQQIADGLADWGRGDVA